MHKQRISKHNVIVGSEPFLRGFSMGMAGGDRRFDLCPPITEDRVVTIVRNLTEMAIDGELREDHLLYDCGLLTGYIVAAMDTLQQRG